MQNTTLNGYTLRRLLGKGGMAEVWYAENRLGKPAAVKIMLAHLLTLPSVVERFEIEAKAMVRLDHPNIRQVFDYGEWQGRPFIVMEYLEGQTLSDVISNKKNVTDVTYLGWWQSCLDALQHTHSKNIIHRDIKPSNIFLCNDGTLKLLDFGIAKVKDEISHTQTGQGLGTKVYMSPEQITDPKRVTTATDVYSLAVTFVHLLRKQTPFDDTDSDYKLFDQIVKGQINLQGISAEWLKRLKPCLTTTSNQRLTAEQCLEKSTESTKKGDKTEIIPTPPNEKEKKAKTGDLLKPVYAPSPLEKYLPWGLAVAALAIVLWVILKPDPEIDLIPANQKVDYYTRQQKPKPSVTTSSPQQQVNQAPQQQVIDSDAAPKEKFLKGIKMIKIPGKNFYMGETEVTIGQYLQFCKATNGNYPEWLELGNQYNIYSGSDDSYRKAGMSESNTRNPVTGISWTDAVAFCQWAGGRLPTEEEWEYSANGGQNFEYAGSNNIDEVAWHSGNSGGRSHSVKGKKPNSFGLFDMIGNVWEWTSTSDGSGRVLRGGYWDYHAVLRGTAIRLSYPPGLRDVCLGFRLVSPH